MPVGRTYFADVLAMDVSHSRATLVGGALLSQGQWKAHGPECIRRAEAECEAKLAELIWEMKTGIAALRTQSKTG